MIHLHPSPSGRRLHGCTTPWMEEVRAHGWAKVEQCRSNCRERRREQPPRRYEPMDGRGRPRRELVVESNAGSGCRGPGGGKESPVCEYTERGPVEHL